MSGVLGVSGIPCPHWIPCQARPNNFVSSSRHFTSCRLWGKEASSFRAICTVSSRLLSSASVTSALLCSLRHSLRSCETQCTTLLSTGDYALLDHLLLETLALYRLLPSSTGINGALRVPDMSPRITLFSCGGGRDEEHAIGMDVIKSLGSAPGFP